ncbi:MAG: sigma-70 family RNA polymerase sigma factor [Chloroflexi bacterium]|nr:sigma-70 family RNA polymerase sigma factor [Chloroflexota bacterium]OJW04101.1 MAG: hypothetical protein BGO39_06315 [Chloroflexi bacterium 54-19]
MPHLAAAYNLARWLANNDQDAEDIVQEATLRAFKFFGSFKGGDGNIWFLTIVRNTFYTQVSQKGHQKQTTIFDEELHADSSEALNPETILIRQADIRHIKEALMELPPEYREVIILREIEEFSYREIAEILGIPIGTVMSRLGRARKRLQYRLSNPAPELRKSLSDDL